jgi:hypothetical protein
VYYLDESYDAEYIEAVLQEDTEEVDRIEHSAELLRYGPRIECRTIANPSAQRVFCREYYHSVLVNYGPDCMPSLSI